MNDLPCEEFELLVSADLDGELDCEEQRVLQRHLADCPACRDWRDVCRRLAGDLMAVATPAYNAPDENPVARLAPNGHRSGNPTAGVPEIAPKGAVSSRRMRLGLGERWFLAVAALLLVAIGVSFGVFARRSRETTSFNVEPLVAMHAINVQTEQDQLATLRTVEMELRMMRLEMKQIQLAPGDREQMEKRIESLLSKTRHMDASTQVLYQGE